MVVQSTLHLTLSFFVAERSLLFKLLLFLLFSCNLYSLIASANTCESHTKNKRATVRKKERENRAEYVNETCASCRASLSADTVLLLLLFSLQSFEEYKNETPAESIKTMLVNVKVGGSGRKAKNNQFKLITNNKSFELAGSSRVRLGLGVDRSFLPL